ncbi:hypothetical protein DSUL_160075 [Desulfovibrionales bacterium]
MNQAISTASPPLKEVLLILIICPPPLFDCYDFLYFDLAAGISHTVLFFTAICHIYI